VELVALVAPVPGVVLEPLPPAVWPGPELNAVFSPVEQLATTPTGSRIEAAMSESKVRGRES
ncbi:MAG TPA: hypothetical protein VIV60_35155, partial [Polyangiaceae bacterium]